MSVPAREGNRAASAPKRWLFRVVALGIGLVLCEVVLSLGAMISPRLKYHTSPPWNRATRPDPVLGQCMSPFYPGNDSWGYRNNAVPNTCDLLAIGDSMTYGFATTPGNSWPRQLERICGRATYNMSCGGYGPCEYRVLVEKGLALRPNTVIIGLTIDNDLGDCCRTVYIDGRLPEFRRTEEETDQELVGWLAEQVKHRASLAGDGSQQGNRLKKWISEHSALYGLIRAALYSLGWNRYSSLLREDDPPQDAYEVVTQRSNRLGFDSDPRFRTVFFPPNEQKLDLDRSHVREGKRITEEIILGMHERLKSLDVRLIVVLIPTKQMVYREIFGQHTFFDGDFEKELCIEERLTTEIEQFLEDRQIEYVNTTSSIRSCFVQGVRPYPESDDGHLNSHGYKAIAEAVLPLVAKSKP